jgi:ElaB/YqjD/DUF883 family membrane-anchored ribosome-binding protein
MQKLESRLIANEILTLYRTQNDKRKLRMPNPKGSMPTRNGGTELRSFQETKAKLVDDLKLVAEDAEELMKATGGELTEKTREVRERLRMVLDDAKVTCAQLEEQAEAGFRVADQTIRENPYRSIGVAAGVGFLIGCLIKRR